MMPRTIFCPLQYLHPSNGCYKVVFLVIFSLLIIRNDAFNQPTSLKFSHVTGESVTANVGTVNYIFKDSKGFMWFGTSRGVQRFDGYQLKLFNGYPKDTANNISRLVNVIFEDDRQNLWVGTNYHGLNLLDRKTEKFISCWKERGDSTGIHKAGILSIYQDKEGTLWFGVIEGGLFRYDYGRGTFQRFLIDTTTEISMKNNVWSIVEGMDRNLWIATAGGIFTFDRDSGIFRQYFPVPAPPREYAIFQFITSDIEGNIWIGSYWGIYVYSPATGMWQHFLPGYPLNAQGPSTNYIGEIREYISGNRHEMWIATTWGLNKYDYSTGKFTHLFQDSRNPSSLRNNLSSGLYLDANGLLWTASGGASKLDLSQDQFIHYEVKSWPDSLHDLDANTIYEDCRGHYWVGTYGDGIYEFDSSMKFIGNYKPTPPEPVKPDSSYRNRIACIYEDSRQNLWVSTWRFSVCIFDRQRKSFRTVPFHFPHGYSEPYDIEEILEDHSGIIWLAANDGLFYVNSDQLMKTPVTVVEDPVLSRAKILDLYEDTKGVLWVITLGNGIYFLPPENRGKWEWERFKEEQYDHKDRRPSTARFVYEDIYGRIWFLSLRGLYYYDAEADMIVRHDHFDHVYPGFIYQFTGDELGHLWIVTDYGLLKYNPQDTTLRLPRLYDTGDGMPFDEIQHGPIFTDSKRFIFCSSWGGSGRGFFKFNPLRLKKDNTVIPPVVLTDFKVSNKPYLLDTSVSYIGKIELKHNENFFSFEFSALDYFDPDKNQYAYMLEGLDEDWIYSGNRRFANYTGVPPGDYIFRVKGSNNDGYWNEEGASVRISIAEPPWTSWWATTLYVLFSISVVFSIIWYYFKRQQLRHALEIEHLQKEQLAEMDKMKSRFFANISHEFRTPLTLILGPIENLKSQTTDRKCLDDLNIMQRNAYRLRRLIDQLLSLSRIEAGQMKLHARENNVVTFIKGYFLSFESAAKQKDILWTFTSDSDDIPLYFDRDKMEKIMYNLLSNALKFAPEGGRVVVKVSSTPPPLPSPKLVEVVREGVVISISDTGPGIAPQHLPHIFDRFYQADDSDSRFQEGSGIGLALVKELVELHHGTITVYSEPGKGTTFVIRLPLGKEHLKEEEIADGQPPPRPSPNLGEGEREGAQPGTRNQKPENVHAAPIVLLVEDNADMRHYIGGLLEDRHEVLESKDGLDGFETAISRIPDLVLSDVMMPGMDGYELCSRLKTDERTSHIPVILLTAKASMEDKLEGLETGADDFITKPFEPAELMVRVRNLLRQRQMLREKFRRELEHVTLVPETSMTPMEAKFMEKARKVVGENISNPDFGIADFSRQMNMSRVQLHRKLVALFNLSASAFIRTSRLNAAARLLESKSGNVAQIAFEVGFNNLSYFSKCFREQFGCLPSEYPM